MHDFDPGQRERQEAREEALINRGFTVRGEEFTYKPNVGFQVVRDISLLNERTPGSSVVDTMVRAIKGIIENTVTELPEDQWDEPADGADPVAKTVTAHERWDAVCDPEREFPVTFEDLHEISNWLIKEAVNRPTVRPGHSSPGSDRNGSASTENSPGERAEASTV